MKALPKTVTDAEIVEDFRAYVEWVRHNPPPPPCPYPNVRMCAMIYSYVHMNDHGDQVHAAVYADIAAKGDADVVVRDDVLGFNPLTPSLCHCSSRRLRSQGVEFCGEGLTARLGHFNIGMSLILNGNYAGITVRKPCCCG